MAMKAARRGRRPHGAGARAGDYPRPAQRAKRRPAGQRDDAAGPKASGEMVDESSVRRQEPRTWRDPVRAVTTTVGILMAGTALLAGVVAAAAPVADPVAGHTLTTTGPTPPATVKPPTGARRASAGRR